MREKKPSVVFTFDTTAAAVAMERLCHREGLPGRLIPVPRSLTADCGMAWCAPVEARGALENAKDLPEYAGIHELMI